MRLPLAQVVKVLAGDPRDRAQLAVPGLWSSGVHSRGPGVLRDAE